MVDPRQQELRTLTQNEATQRQRVQTIQSRLRQEGISNQLQNRLQDDLAIAEAELRGIDKTRSAIQRGFTIRSAQDVGEFEGAKTREGIQLKKRGFKSPAQIRLKSREQKIIEQQQNIRLIQKSTPIFTDVSGTRFFQRNGSVVSEFGDVVSDRNDLRKVTNREQRLERANLSSEQVEAQRNKAVEQSQTRNLRSDSSRTASFISATKEGDFGEGVFLQPSFSERIKTKSKEIFAGLGALPFATSTALSQTFEEAEKELAETGRKIPTDLSQLEFPKSETLQFIPEFLTDAELEKLSFGGLEQLAKRNEARLDFEARQIINAEVKLLEPSLQKDIELVVADFKSGKLSQSNAEQQLQNLEDKFEKDVLLNADPRINIKTKEVQSYINVVAKKQRKVRALLLAPVVFGEGFLFGKLLVGAGAVAGAVTPSALGSSEAVRLGLSAGFLGLIALQTPKIVAGVKEDPLSFLLENAPFLAGTVVGANPNVVKKLGNAGKKFLRFEKKLFNDNAAKAGSKTRQKQKQVQVQKSKQKAKVTRQELKELLKNAGTKERKLFMKEQLENINKLTDPTEQLLAKQQLASLVLEVETGVNIITDTGALDFNQLQVALSQTKLKPQIKLLSVLNAKNILQPDVDVKFPSQVSDRIPEITSSKFSSLGVFEGKIKRLDNQTATQNKIKLNLEKALARSKLLEKQATTPFQKNEQKNRQKQIKRQLEQLRQKQNQLNKQSSLLRTQQLSKQDLKLRQKQVQVQRQRFKSKFGRPSTRFFKPIPFIPFKDLKGLKKRKKIKSKKLIPLSRRGYHVLGKPIRTKKFRKLNRVPLTKKKAKDLGAWLIDNSLARTFKLQRAKKSAKKPKLRVPKDYFAKTRIKYRDFRIKKGEKIPLKNKWIEKKGKFLLDTKSERNKITLLRKLAGLKKKSFKPTKSKMKSTKEFKTKKLPKRRKK